MAQGAAKGVVARFIGSGPERGRDPTPRPRRARRRRDAGLWGVFDDEHSAHRARLYGAERVACSGQPPRSVARGEELRMPKPPTSKRI